MRIRVLGSFGSRSPGCHTSGLLVNGRLLIDAGTATSALPLEEQAAIDEVLLTHAHLDHVADLAFLADNVLTRRARPLRVRGPEPVLATVRRHLLNDQVWPDLTRLKAAGRPPLELLPLPPAEESAVCGLTVRWARTSHPVFTAGYLLEDGAAAVLHSADTGPTGELWRLGRECPQLAAAFVETSFPDRLAELAAASGHLTPALLAAELAKLNRPEVAVKIFHMKPRFLDEIVRELHALGDGRLQVLQGGEEFLF